MTVKPAKGTANLERRRRRRQCRTSEVEAKQAVRRRDAYCRFPLCGCKRHGYALHVSHQRHKGMGGNPAGDRSTSATMVLVCAPRHREHLLSIDRGTLRWRALTDRGADGPIAWECLSETAGVLCSVETPADTWRELARERALHIYEPLTDEQKYLLGEIARMRV